jgi:hypothetical protein
MKFKTKEEYLKLEQELKSKSDTIRAYENDFGQSFDWIFEDVKPVAVKENKSDSTGKANWGTYEKIPKNEEKNPCGEKVLSPYYIPSDKVIYFNNKTIKIQGSNKIDSDEQHKIIKDAIVEAREKMKSLYSDDDRWWEYSYGTSKVPSIYEHGCKTDSFEETKAVKKSNIDYKTQTPEATTNKYVKYLEKQLREVSEQRDMLNHSCTSYSKKVKVLQSENDRLHKELELLLVNPDVLKNRQLVDPYNEENWYD